MNKKDADHRDAETEAPKWSHLGWVHLLDTVYAFMHGIFFTQKKIKQKQICTNKLQSNQLTLLIKDVDYKSYNKDYFLLSVTNLFC